jgi:type IV pilus assembly protein PilB
MLIQKLVEKKIITEDQASSLEKEFREEFVGTNEEDFLLIKKILNEQELNKIKSEIYDLPVFEETEDLIIPLEILSLVPEESARFYQAIPLKIEEGVLQFGIVNPENIKAREAINFLARQQRYKIDFYLINNRQFEKYLKQYQALNKKWTLP